MPVYDYECKKCGEGTEISHKAGEGRFIKCVACGGKMRKVVSGFYVGNLGRPRTSGRNCESDMRAEMKEDFGIEDFKPITAKGVGEVYQNVKQQGGLVKEQMAARREQTDRTQKDKMKSWHRDAVKRTPERAREKIDRRKAEDYSKRRVSV